MSDLPLSPEDYYIRVPLTESAVRAAQQFAREQPTRPKAQQVYINTLAVCVVNNYLRLLGIPTNLTASNIWNPSARLASDTADLWITGSGRLECRPVESGAISCHIPPELSFDRIGYVVVQLEKEGADAVLLGFAQRAGGVELLLHQLRPLPELPAYLNQCRPIVNLSQWFQGVFETDWHTDETLLPQAAPESLFCFRDHPSRSVRRCKLIQLGTQGSVVLIAAIASETGQRLHVMVKVQPLPGEPYLPPHLHLTLLDEDDNVLKSGQAKNDNQSIQFLFRGELGDYFSIEVALGEVSVIENFVI